MSATPDRRAARGATALFAGLLFGAGLVVSGMTLPAKVCGFLDFGGAWDPTLALVMIGAIGVHAIAYVIMKRRAAPVLDGRFLVPPPTAIDRRLLVGAAIFGVGWGLGGFCPGPAITSLLTLSPSVVAFVVAMLAGSWLTAFVEARRIDASGVRAGEGRSVDAAPADA